VWVSADQLRSLRQAAATIDRAVGVRKPKKQGRVTGGRARLRLRVACWVGCVGAVALLFSASSPAGADVPVAVSAFPQAAGAGLDDIVLGPDGALWFTETAANTVGRINSAGAVTDYPLTRTPGSAPGTITVGPDGALWFVMPGRDDVGRITTAGAISEIPLTTAMCNGTTSADPVGIASGPDGNVWATEDFGTQGAVAEVDLGSGDTVTEHCIGSVGEPGPIVPVSGSSFLWFTIGDDEFATISGTGNVSPEVLTGASTAGTIPIVAGSDGNLWLGIQGAPSRLDRLTTGAVVTPFDLPSNSTANTEVLASGPDGQLWLAGGGGLTSVTTAGAVNSFAGIYPAGDAISAIAAGPGDTLWLADSTDSTIYRVTLGNSSLAASLLPVADVAGTSAVVSGLLSVPAGDLASSASYAFQYGATNAYGLTTMPATATATPNGTEVTATLAGLAADETYHYRLVVSGCAPTVCTANSADQSFTTGVSLLVPVLNQTVAVAGISGTVRVRLPGRHRHFVRVTSARLIPVGAEIDARHGRVLIESATATAPQQVASGQFSGGRFTVRQPLGSTTTVLRLDSHFGACPRPRHGVFAARRIGKPSHKVVNQVFGNAHGAYSTRGQYAAAADEGTGWHIADRCDGTEVAVTLGTVQVTNLVSHRSFALTAGEHYLATPR
jgi:virginiamycin B lyase